MGDYGNVKPVQLKERDTAFREISMSISFPVIFESKHNRARMEITVDCYCSVFLIGEFLSGIYAL